MRSLFLLIQFVFLLLLANTVLLAQRSVPSVLLNKEVVKISGVIENAGDTDSITFRFYKDYITFDEIDFTVSIDKEYFTLDIPAYVSTPGFVVYNGHTIPIFLEEGDNLLLHSHHASFSDSLRYSHKGSLRNNYLKKSFIKFDKQDADLAKESMLQNDTEDFVLFMEEYKQQKQSFLEEYLSSRDTSFSAEFNKYIEADILYWWGQNMFQYKDHHPTSRLVPVALNLPDEFYDFVENVELNNEDVLNNTNYLKYLEHYTNWRQDRIDKGLLKVDKKPIKRSQVAIARVISFAEIMMHNAPVREKAHDANSTIATLAQKTKVLYLNDVTNDKFKFRYKERNYIGPFVKIQLADGRNGWIPKMGVRTFEDEVSEIVSLDLPKGSEDILNQIRYSSFRGKVLHYAISKDFYEDIQHGKRVTKPELDNYIQTSPYEEYVQIIRDAYAERKYNQPVPASSLRGTSDDKEVTDQINKFTKNLINLLEIAEVEQQQEKTFAKTKMEEILSPKEEVIAQEEQPIIPQPVPEVIKKVAPVKVEKPIVTKKAILSEVKVNDLNFEAYQQKTYLRFKSNFTSSDQPSIIINQNPFLNDYQERKLGTVTTGRSFITFSTDLATPSYWQLKNRTNAVDLYFEPGDDIQVEIIGSDIYTQTTFTGSNSAENSYLLAQAAAFKHIPKVLQQKVAVEKPLNFKLWMDDIRQQKLNFFYNNMKGLNPTFLAYAEANINYWYAFNLMNYLYDHPLLNDEEFPMEAPVGYLDFMNTISIHNDSALPNKFYILYIQEYLAHLHKLPNNKGKNRLQLAEEYLSGKTKDFLSVILYSLDAKMPKKRAELSHQINQFESTTIDPVYAEFVKKAFHDEKGLTEGMAAPNFSLVDQYGKTVHLSDFKGQIVLIDFWATWCGPCIDLMPVHRSLQERYKGKNIAFVYISMDNKESIWKNYLSTKHLGGQHLISNEAMGFKSPISKDYQIKYLPYTFLLDTNGTIIWKRTGGFSVSIVNKIIDDLLRFE